MDTTKKIEILESAANLIRTAGLAKGVYRDESDADPKPPLECPHCAMGALVDAGFPGLLVMSDPSAPTYHPEYLLGDLLTDVAQEIDPEAAEVQSAFHVVAYWNDDPERTEEDVAQLFERVAQKLEA
jgi:hypothetical protein